MANTCRSRSRALPQQLSIILERCISLIFTRLCLSNPFSQNKDRDRVVPYICPSRCSPVLWESHYVLEMQFTYFQEIRFVQSVTLICGHCVNKFLYSFLQPSFQNDMLFYSQEFREWLDILQ